LIHREIREVREAIFLHREIREIREAILVGSQGDQGRSGSHKRSQSFSLISPISL
jgi:hypothetical protein